MKPPTRKVIAVGGQFRDLLTLSCRHVVSIEAGQVIPKRHICWQCSQFGKLADAIRASQKERAL